MLSVTLVWMIRIWLDVQIYENWFTLYKSINQISYDGNVYAAAADVQQAISILLLS